MGDSCARVRVCVLVHHRASRDATFEGDRPMALSTHATSASSAPLSDKPTRLHLNWGERIVTAVAASIAVLIVATIAVLMGMA
jgi:hypothetical protein